MSQKRIYINIAIIFILTFLAAGIVYPRAEILGARIFPQFFPERPFKLGLDLQGGTHLIYQADLSNIEKKDYNSSMQGLRDIIERRVNLFGVREPIVQTQEATGQYRLIVELAGIKDPAEAIKMIGQTPFLEFREPKENYQEILRKNQKAIEVKGKEAEIEEPFQATPLTGKYLKKAEVGFEQTTYQPLILLQFDKKGAEIFEELTARNIGKPLAIYIDGIPISIPTVQEKIAGGKAQITGRFTVDEAKALARNLNAGALPVPITLISQQSVGPTLGEISLKKSLKAGILGLIGIIVFLLLFYRLAGIVASLALGIYLILILALFKLIPVTLTLAGIGGFILSLGMAVDANILIFSRMREELAEGKSFGVAVEEGFRRAWPSIRDGNFTTLIVALILFGFGSSFVKGFAFTLTIGILMSIFSAIFITKTFLRFFSGKKVANFKWLW